MTAQLALFGDGGRPGVTPESVLRALDCGVPLLVREVWACVGADRPGDATAVADALLRLEAAGRARCDLETMRWEAT